jgi:alkylation response protein AidB-like acyl-CoA dehydrogenase
LGEDLVRFVLDEQQRLVFETVRSLLKDHLPSERLHAIFDGDEPLDAALWSSFVALGLPAIMIGEAYGGSGLEMIDAAVVAEALGYGAAPIPFLGHVLAALAIEGSADEEARRQWLPKLADGSVVGTVALCDGDGRWLPERWTLEERDGYLNGLKLFVPAAGSAPLMVWSSPGHRGCPSRESMGSTEPAA